MTTEWLDATLLLMAIKGKPGRRSGTPYEYQEVVKARLRKGREDARLDIPAMAAELSAAIGRPITADTYRKWESESLLPHDAILPACDILELHVFKLLGGVTPDERESLKKSFGKKIPFLRQARSAS